ncbi:MAG: hypothetical protein K6T75_11115, partial [Acetobacteraceae bacterium]|nr:hypothetical protein [Acetobacteraceae bacterium]
SLLDPQNHLEVLDRFAGAESLALRAEVSALYSEWKQLTRERAGLLGDQRDRARRLDLLRFQVGEIDAAQLREGEEEELEQRRRVLENAEKLFSVASSAFTGLYEGEGHRPAALDIIRSAASSLAEAARIDPSLQPWAQALEEAGFGVEEVARALARYRETVPFDPALRAQVDQRLDLLHGLKRKYGDTLAEILAYRAQAAAEMERLERSDELAAELDERMAAVLDRLGRAAAELSRRRLAAADQLGSRVQREIASLGMEAARFKVSVAQEEDPAGVEVEGRRLAMTASGLDRVEFLFTANPGEPLRPLARIASGGEMARAMLGIKAVLAEADAIPTMIFDEVDAGIGGRTVQAVADRLHQVGRRRQVLCVTHLPQIACLADAHFAVFKEVSDGRTRALARRLKEAERVDELARMLGGADLTGVTLEHARELLERGRQRRGRPSRAAGP